MLRLTPPLARPVSFRSGTTPAALAESQRVRTLLLGQRYAVERAWGPIESMSDQIIPGRLVLRTARGYVLILGIADGELWVDAQGSSDPGVGRGR
jgi:hypothetical protein